MTGLDCSAYRSHLHRAVCIELGIRHKRTRPYTPRTNGKVERFIQTLTNRWAYGRSYQNSAGRTAALAGWLHYYNTSVPTAASTARRRPSGWQRSW